MNRTCVKNEFRIFVQKPHKNPHNQKVPAVSAVPYPPMFTIYKLVVSVLHAIEFSLYSVFKSRITQTSIPMFACLMHLLLYICELVMCMFVGRGRKPLLWVHGLVVLVHTPHTRSYIPTLARDKMQHETEPSYADAPPPKAAKDATGYGL
jgi:hypothetical protein